MVILTLTVNVKNRMNGWIELSVHIRLQHNVRIPNQVEGRANWFHACIDYYHLLMWVSSNLHSYPDSTQAACQSTQTSSKQKWSPFHALQSTIRYPCGFNWDCICCTVCVRAFLFIEWNHLLQVQRYGDNDRIIAAVITHSVRKFYPSLLFHI